MKCERKCEICEAEFHVFPSVVLRGQGHTCSRKCQVVFLWKHHGAKMRLALKAAHTGNSYARGRKHTAVERRKIQRARATQVITTETRRKLSEAGKGRPYHPRKREMTHHERAERSRRASGSNNPFWKGGINALSAKIRHSMQYKDWRSAVFKRDNYVCVQCGYAKGHIIEADHIKQFSVLLTEHKIKTFDDALKCTDLWDVNNGRTLCRPCHQKTDTYLNRWWRRSQAAGYLPH